MAGKRRGSSPERSETPEEKSKGSHPASSRRLYPAFSDLIFGKSAAERESIEHPDLLLDGFLDIHNAAERLLKGTEFLVLGYKGSGKSAISQHLKLRSERDYGLFVTNVYLADFPYEEFAEIGKDVPDAHARYPAIWTWLLLLYILDSLTHDEALDAHGMGDFMSLVTKLRGEGLIPSLSVPQLLRKSKSRTFTVGTAGIATAELSESEAAGSVNLGPVVERVLQILGLVSTDSDHVVIIDGLDDVLLGQPVQTEALAALVLAVSRLNRRLEQDGSFAKIILLCRTDLYESLTLPNKNKIKQDSAIVLDWYQDTNQPRNTQLVRLTNLKVKVHHPAVSDLFGIYFPTEIKRRPVLNALLDFTRHTPRDFLRLLRFIQEMTTSSDQLSEAQILGGIRNYSIDYFLGEIYDELEGFIDQSQVGIGRDLLSSFNQQHFGLSEIRAYAQSDARFKPLKLEYFLERMFECSGLGNVQRGIDGSKDYFTFKYRNRRSSINFNDPMRIHQGLWQGLGLTGGKGFRGRLGADDGSLSGEGSG